MVTTNSELIGSDKPLPRELLKFRTFAAEGRDGHDSKMVFNMLQGRIPFSRIESFNDPFEGRPYAVPAFDDPAKQRQAMQSYLVGILTDRGKTPTEARKEAGRMLQGKTLSEVVSLFGRSQRSIYSDENLVVFCTSSGAALKAPLAWSHYADCHRGLCIHFDTTFQPFIPAYKIEYSTEYPVVTVPRTEADEREPIRKGLLWKSDLWKYEHEYRVIKAPEDSLQVKWEGHVAITSPKAAIKVSLGARMPELAREKLMLWAESNATHIEFWQARLHDRRYELEFDRIR